VVSDGNHVKTSGRDDSTSDSNSQQRSRRTGDRSAQARLVTETEGHRKLEWACVALFGWGAIT